MLHHSNKAHPASDVWDNVRNEQRATRARRVSSESVVQPRSHWPHPSLVRDADVEHNLALACMTAAVKLFQLTPGIASAAAGGRVTMQQVTAEYRRVASNTRKEQSQDIVA